MWAPCGSWQGTCQKPGLRYGEKSYVDISTPRFQDLSFSEIKEILKPNIDMADWLGPNKIRGLR